MTNSIQVSNARDITMNAQPSYCGRCGQTLDTTGNCDCPLPNFKKKKSNAHLHTDKVKEKAKEARRTKPAITLPKVKL